MCPQCLRSGVALRKDLRGCSAQRITPRLWRALASLLRLSRLVPSAARSASARSSPPRRAHARQACAEQERARRARRVRWPRLSFARSSQSTRSAPDPTWPFHARSSAKHDKTKRLTRTSVELLRQTPARWMPSSTDPMMPPLLPLHSLPLHSCRMQRRCASICNNTPKRPQTSICSRPCHDSFGQHLGVRVAGSSRWERNRWARMHSLNHAHS